MKYIIHIGTHKTGSTALQNFLFKNRNKLIEKGVLYPIAGSKDHAHHNIAWLARSGDSKKLDEIFSSIDAEAESTGAESVVLSSEEFEFIRARPLIARILKLKPTIVMYLRRQDYYLESEYNQHVKMYSLRYRHDIYRFYYHNDFMPRFNYKYLCELWTPDKGSNTLKLINYDRCLSDRHGIFKEFLSLIGVEWDDEFVLPDQAASNISLPNIGTIYLARMNAIDLSRSNHQGAIDVVIDRFAGLPKRQLLPIEERMALWHRFAAGNTFINKHYDVESFDKPGSSAYENLPVIDFCEDFDAELYKDMLNIIIR